MWLCSLDAHERSQRLVLSVGGNFVEGKAFRGTANPARLSEEIETWETEFGRRVDVVLVDQPSTARLAVELEQWGHQVRWVRPWDLEAFVDAWRNYGPYSRWLRGLWMSQLLCSRDCLGPDGRKLAVDWVYEQLRGHVLELEAMLYDEGRCYCPHHLSDRCPNCHSLEDLRPTGAFGRDALPF